MVEDALRQIVYKFFFKRETGKLSHSKTIWPSVLLLAFEIFVDNALLRREKENIELDSALFLVAVLLLALRESVVRVPGSRHFSFTHV